MTHFWRCLELFARRRQPASWDNAVPFPEPYPRYGQPPAVCGNGHSLWWAELSNDRTVYHCAICGATSSYHAPNKAVFPHEVDGGDDCDDCGYYRQPL